MKHRWIFQIVTLCIAATALGTELNDVALRGLPEWAAQYEFMADRVPLNIRLLARKENLSLRNALEVQNHYLDMIDDAANSKSPEEKFQAALARVESGKNIYESVWNADKIAHADFIVVFDLDDTLFSEYYTCGNKGEKYRDIKLQDTCLNPAYKLGSHSCGNCIKFAPGWKEAIERIKASGGAVIIFTAKRDPRAQRIMKRWMWDADTPFLEAIDGLLTKNHLTLVPKIGKPSGRVRAMKDLQLIDPTLRRIVMVDDSPGHTYQPLNVRPVQRFLPDSYLADGAPSKLRKMYENTLKEATAEIVESAEYARKNGVSFAEAFKPYSLVGRYALFDLMDTGLPKAEAVDLLRHHPDVIENKF